MIVVAVCSVYRESPVVNMIRKIISSSGKKVSTIESHELNSLTSESSVLKNYIEELEKSGVDTVIIEIIPEKILEAIYDNIHINILVYDSLGDDKRGEDDRNTLYRQKEIFQKMCKEDIAIINIDDKKVLQLLEGSKMQVIPYGFSSKVTITASSIEEGTNSKTLIYCLQRAIRTLKEKIIEPQEFPVNVVYDKNIGTYDILAAVTVALLCDVDTELIKELSF